MKTKVQRWGNSLAVRIPKAFAEELGVEDNTEVDLALHDEELVIRPVGRLRFSLSELLEQVTEDNLHSEVETGPAVGDEAW